MSWTTEDTEWYDHQLTTTIDRSLHNRENRDIIRNDRWSEYTFPNTHTPLETIQDYLNTEVDTERHTVVPRHRALRSEWTMDYVTGIEPVYGINFERELRDTLTREIDDEILQTIGRMSFRKKDILPDELFILD